MLRAYYHLLLSILVLINLNIDKVLCQMKSALTTNKYTYPQFKQIKKTWTFRSAKHGNVTFADPFYWLEKPLSTDKDVIDFIDKQTKVTEDFMKKCTNKEAIKQSILNSYDFDDYDRMGLVADAAKPFYLYRLKRAKEERPTWYTASPSEFEIAKKNNFATPPGKKYLEEILLSPNGTHSVTDMIASPDGKFAAILVSDSNSIVATWYLRTFDSPLVNRKTRPIGGEGHLPDVIPFCDGGIQWSKDSKGFFYTQTQDSKAGANTELGSTVRYHQIGTSHEKDVTIVHADKVASDGKNNAWSINLIDHGQWLIVTGTNDVTDYARAYATFLPGETLSDKMKWISISPTYDYSIEPINVIDDILYLQTNRKAIDGKIVKVKLDRKKARQVNDLSELQERLEFIDVIPTKRFSKIELAAVFNVDKVVVFYIINGRYKPQLFNLKTGKFMNDILPNEASSVYSIIRTVKSNSMVLMYSGLTSPRTAYEVSIEGMHYKESKLLVQNIKGTVASDYVTENLFATSKDGTKVPYTIVYHKNTKKDGSSVAWMHFYASYGSIETSYWDPNYFAFLSSYGGFFVWVSARGGGDRGEEWHVAGQKQNKHKSFEDIIAVAQDLVKRRIAAPRKVIGEGGSAGGLAAAVVANQAPSDTFGAIFPARAACDMFLIPRSRHGADQIGEFGNVNDPKDFDDIYDYSPLQNVSPNHTYPAILLTPGEGDDLVVASHSFKFLAQLQLSHPKSPMPLLMHLIRSGGHTFDGLSTDTAVQESVHQHCVAEVSLNLKRVK